MLRGRTAQALSFLIAVVAVWATLLLLAGRAGGLIGAGDRFSVPLWVGRRLTRAWLNSPARALGGGVAPATDEELLDFFAATSRVAADERDVAYAETAGRDASDTRAQLARARSAANRLGPAVELRLSSELSSVVADAGLSAALPFGIAPRLVWPPIQFSFSVPPFVLIRSPRDRIELLEATLLDSDLSQARTAAIARRAESGGDSVLVVRVGGVATYPAIVEDDDDYADCLKLVAHEWTHQYLAFHPLGVRYFTNQDMATINETVANLVGHELATAMLARFPLPGNPEKSVATAPPPDRAVDFDRTMHELRLQVDGLLAQGRVSEAEARMDETRTFLLQHGYYVPQINQAYFAFYGTYANTAASTSPVGPELATVRSRSAGLRQFVRRVEVVRSAQDLRRLATASGG